jgi:hypothetical protein
LPSFSTIKQTKISAPIVVVAKEVSSAAVANVLFKPFSSFKAKVSFYFSTSFVTPKDCSGAGKSLGSVQEDYSFCVPLLSVFDENGDKAWGRKF